MTAALPFDGVLFGAAYYAEYQPEGTLERDLDLMQAAGFSVIRVGESVWSTWEPRDGEFALDWLQPVLDGARARGIAVVLGTPTYAVPMWLARKHPEIASETSTGHRIGWGGRQEMDQSHPAYRFHAERVARKVVERYASHPAVIGFQVDNEPGLMLPHNEHTFQGFVDWLKGRYGSVDRLNREWGLVYWSHLLTDWADLWRPDGNHSPQYALEWRRYQSTLATDLIGWQAAVVREYARPDQFVTTCISYSRPQVSDDELAASLDVTAGNPYYRMQDGLDAGADEERHAAWNHRSVWALFQWADRAWSTKQAPYLVTETNAQSISGPWDNHPPYPGQLKQAAFALLARGGRMVEYWHWHTLHFGTETYWGGVLPHSQRPGRVYREVASLGADLKALGTALDGFEPDADVLVVWSTDSKWDMETQSPLAMDDGASPDRASYQRIVDAHYRGLFEAGAQVRMMHARQLAESDPADLARRHPVLVAAGLYVADDETLAVLGAYAEAGGHLVLGIRTGYGDALGRARLAVAPAGLADAAGAWYDEYSNLEAPLPVSAADGFELEAGSAGVEWVDVLQVQDAEVLAVFDETELGAAAAVTTRSSGAGRVTVVAAKPNPELSRSLARWLVPSPAAARWDAAPSTSVTTGTRGGARIAFVSNWSGSPAVVVAPSAAVDLVTGAAYAAGDPVPLERRGVVVLEVADDSTE
ncbi:beta-galactosidase [Amnibacterium kyonggiense]